MEHAEPIKKPSLRERYESLLKEYGTIAVATYLGFSLLTIATFFVAFQFGFKKVEGSVEPTGGLGLGATHLAPISVFYGQRALSRAHKARRRRCPSSW